MVIGRSNLFEVGSRIFFPAIIIVFFDAYADVGAFVGVESASVGDHNTFEAKARVSAFTRISDWCTIGAGCTLLPNVSSLGGQPTSSTLGDVSESDGTAPPPLSDACELLPIGTVVFGSESKRRAWSLEGQEQAAQLHEKHLGALREASRAFLRHASMILKQFFCAALPARFQSPNRASRSFRCIANRSTPTVDGASRRKWITRQTPELVR